jgi:uncharacterized protein
MSDKTCLPWWRYGMVWLVIGGPAVVVIACIATLVIALTHPDPVLRTAEVPAVQARNLGPSK